MDSGVMEITDADALRAQAQWEGFPHLTASQQFNRESLDALFTFTDFVRDSFRNGTAACLREVGKRKRLGSLFFEPSTRTEFSFSAAADELGMTVINAQKPDQFSSVVKGESIEDMIRVLGGPRDPHEIRMVDVFAIRHPEVGMADRAARASHVPVINAGDGWDQHPTQALTDVYTIRSMRGGSNGCVDGIHVGMMGDIKNSRTIRSLAYLLGKAYQDIRLTFIAPRELELHDGIDAYLGKHDVSFAKTESLDDVIHDVDVLYVTRLQLERATGENLAALKGTVQLRPEHIEHMKDDAVVLHPLPIDNADPPRAEIHPELQESARHNHDPRLAWFTQCNLGISVRIALLWLVLDASPCGSME